ERPLAPPRAVADANGLTVHKHAEVSEIEQPPSAHREKNWFPALCVVETNSPPHPCEAAAHSEVAVGRHDRRPTRVVKFRPREAGAKARLLIGRAVGLLRACELPPGDSDPFLGGVEINLQLAPAAKRQGPARDTILPM